MTFTRLLRHERLWSFAMVAPALLTVALLFIYPLGFSAVSAFSAEEAGGWTIANFTKAFEFYSNDILFTVIIVALSTLLIAILAIAIGGYLTLGENPRAVAILK